MSLELRMYGLVPYNISPIQQGIQFGHGVVEYERRYGGSFLYNDWASNWKTFIILNGGTTNKNEDRLGTLNKHLITLSTNQIPHSVFYEPDLGDQLTSVNFIADERSFNKDKYPDYNGSYYSNFLGTFPSEVEYNKWLEQFDDTEDVIKKILFLREFIFNFKLT